VLVARSVIVAIGGISRLTARRARPLSAALALVLVIVAGRALVMGNAVAGAAGPRPPSFLVILVDDQAKNSFHRRYMPKTFSSIVDRGTTFINGLAAPPLCCPDRAGILTGQYPHNNGVFSNKPGYGALQDPGDTLPVWLQRAGYRTGMVGRYLARYPGLSAAPGFDRWFTFRGGSYYNYGASDNGVFREYGSQRRDYSTDVLSDVARQFVNRSTNSAAPFFLWLTYNAPHVLRNWKSGPCRDVDPIPPDTASFRRWQDVPLPRPPSFNERNVSDKPARIRRLPRLQKRKIQDITLRWHCTLAAMHEVDKGIGQVMAALKRNGQLRHTIVYYMSDNGLFFGEHRIPFGKGFVYQQALEVPYVVRVPSPYRSGAAQAISGKVVTNQDVAPTLLDYAGRYMPGVEPCAGPGHCRRVDGRSIAPLLGGGGSWPGNRGVLAELDSRLTTGQQTRSPSPECNCAYAAIRTSRFLYSELATGERELYDLRHDPDERMNRAHSPGYSGRRHALASRLDLLRQCSGVQGRDLPGANPFCE
jgi:N-acetylglucosamine-6-sulfatase